MFDWCGSRGVRYEKVNAGCFNFMARFLARLIRQMLAKFFGVESSSKGLYQSSGKEKESCCLLFPYASSTKREIRYNDVVVGKERYKKV